MTARSTPESGQRPPRARVLLVSGCALACLTATPLTTARPTVQARSTPVFAARQTTVAPPQTRPAVATSRPTRAPSQPCGKRILRRNGTPWACVFDDEFTGHHLNRRQWIPQRTANSGFAPGDVCYLDSPHTVTVAHGTLNLTVRRHHTSCGTAPASRYIGGSVSTWQRFTQTYGRYEVRARIPATTSAGLQETFWLWPNTQTVYGPWPASGEIDFAEFYSQWPDWTIPYLHYNYDPRTANWATNTNVVTAWPAPNNQPGTNCRINRGRYNTYTLTWLPGQLSISINGHRCLTDHYRPAGLTSPAPFDQPFMIALTQALGIGTNAPTRRTPLPATTRIDYVRIWR